MSKLHLFLVVLLIVSCSAVAESRDWSFIQSVNGITIDESFKGTDGWLLPAQVDVSGLRTITVKPTQLNSALACKVIKVSVEGPAIYLTVVTGVASSGDNALCLPTNIGQLASGTYSIFYRSPGGKTTQLQEIAIGR